MTTSDLGDVVIRDLLIITHEESHGHDALGLPFSEATVVVLDPGADALGVGGPFDAVVIDHPRLDLNRLERTLRTVRPQLGPGGRVMVLLDACGGGARASAVSEPPDSALHGLAWHGLTSVNGRLCAVLGVAEPAGQPRVSPATLLAVANAAASLSGGGAATISVADARRALARLDEERRRDERALLARIEELTHRADTLAAELDQVRGRIDGARTFRTALRRSKYGRRVLSALRPWRRLVRRAWRATRTRMPAVQRRRRS